MEKEIKIWYDKADYLEVIFEKKKGYLRNWKWCGHGKVDVEGNILGFSILKVSDLTNMPLSVSLKNTV